jgi:phosphosulfolactate synthase (CoM biosynthesis protein A)
VPPKTARQRRALPKQPLAAHVSFLIWENESEAAPAQFSVSENKAAMRFVNTLPSARDLDFDTVEISAGFISIPTDDWLRLIEFVRKSGLKPKPEVGIQFGAGGATAAAELQAEGTRDPDWPIVQAQRFLEAGAEIIMIESEGITENVDPWRTEVPAKFINEIGMDKLMFEAADPDVFAMVHQKLW